MIVLEEHLWSSLACGPRMGLVAVSTLAAGLLAIALKDLLDRALSRLRGMPYGKGNAWAGSRLAYGAAGGLVAIALIAAGFVIALSPSISRILTDGTLLVERGCHRLTPYAREIRLETADIAYRRTEHRRGGESNALVVSGDGHTISLDLESPRDPAMLVQIAPQAMADYARTMQRLGRPLPWLVRLLRQADT